jgi:hypothetical protein
MVPGTILFDPKFRFHDGKTGEKLFVVLNDGRGGSFVTVKTTSNDARYTFVYGCQIMGRHPHFYLPKSSCCLDGQSWLCLDEFYEFDSHELFGRVTDGHIHRIGVLPEAITLELLSCVTNCEDISATHAETILQVWRELKTRNESKK